MKFREALIALTSGKKIRNVLWRKGAFIEIKDDVLYNEAGRKQDNFNLSYTNADENYETVELPKEIWVNEYHDSCSIHLTPQGAEALANPNAVRKMVKYREVKD